MAIAIKFNCEVFEFRNSIEASKKIGITKSKVDNCVDGKNFQSKGYAFARKNDVVTLEGTLDPLIIQTMWESAFGDDATVVINPDGTIIEFDSREKAAKSLNVRTNAVSVYLNKDRAYIDDSGSIIVESQQVKRFKNGKRILDVKMLEQVYKKYIGNNILYCFHSDGKIEKLDSKKLHSFKENNDSVCVRESDIISFDNEYNKRYDYMKILQSFSGELSNIPEIVQNEIIQFFMDEESKIAC